MANRNGYIERDRHGRERVVFTSNRRSSSRTRLSTRELLNAAEEREEVLIARNQQLEAQLSWSQTNESRIQSGLQNLVNEHYACRNLRAQLQAQVDATRRLQDRLKEEKDKNGALGERIRLIQRSSYESYRQRYEETLGEVEILKIGLRDRDELLRLNELRLEKKTQLIIDLKQHLRDLGYRVVE
jgi:hypothetical protein